jgi:GR25 family glycosyltransferase involved in LPS biosynthesis/glycosyltransferase involved in cell wall biosynthesis
MGNLQQAEKLATANEARPKPNQTICLSMIVKNEAPVIRRCLDSVRPIISHWLIVDTGSTDGTQDIIREHLKDLPGELYQRPWQDFAHNRSEALALSRPYGEYSLIIDADDTLALADDFQLPELTADSYVVDIHDSSVHYQRTQLVRNALPWRYQGVLHEYLTCEGAGPSGHLPIVMHRNHDGARRKDPETYRRDVAILENALATEADPFLISRYRFYLAQSLRDCGEREKAEASYLQRAELGFWNEEIYVSLLEAGRLQEALGRDFDTVMQTYVRAMRIVPHRAEAAHAAALLCRLRARHAQGYELAKPALALLDGPVPNGLFVQPWVYHYGLLDEYAINAYWSGHYLASLNACLRILAHPDCPQGDRKRVLDNAKFAADKLPGYPTMGRRAEPDLIAQHAIVTPRSLHSRLDTPPKVLIAILAKQKAPSLAFYLECIEALDYPKSRIVLYIRTNNNTDSTEHILTEWVARVGHLYATVEYDAEDVATRVEQFDVHEWNETRFRVLGRIRNISLSRTLEHDCDFYFVADCDNFIRPCTLRELVALNLPIVAPFLRAIAPGAFYSNYHAEIDDNGYYLDCDQYQWILNRTVRGVIEVPVVHCTYLIRADLLCRLTYEDDTNRFEYVVFSHSARKAGIPQYIDNRQIYGYITFDEGGVLHVPGGIDDARQLLQEDMLAAATKTSDCPLHPTPPSTFGEQLMQLHQIHVINLDRSPRRWELFQSQNPHLKNPIRVAAVDGSQINRQDYIDRGEITEDLPYGQGTLGCALSHMALWKQAVTQNRIMTIFEDDVIVARDFTSRTARIFATLPADWDVIQWGFIFKPSYTWVNFGLLKAELRYYDNRISADPESFQNFQTSSNAVRLAHSFGSQAYSLSPKGAKILLEFCRPLRKQLISFPNAGVVIEDVGLDCAMNGAYENMLAFVCLPPLVMQNDAEDSVRAAIDE